MIYKIPDKGDPSDELQIFPQFNIQVLCCRYWWLKNWEFGELSYPYWRIYWNPYPGATIIHNEKEYELTGDKILVIAPNTSYSTRLFENEIPRFGYTLNGGRIGPDHSEQNAILKNEIPHLFIHFNIGIPYDNIAPQLISLEPSTNWIKKLKIITSTLMSDYSKFDFYTSMVIRSLILDLLVAAIPNKKWELISKDERILNILKFIELNLNRDLANNILAEEMKLATNAFNRLFKDEIGISPQKYIRKKRIDKACALLDHSLNAIDTIAEQTGFADRYHFSKIFKQEIGVSPGKYRKEFNV